MEASAYHVSTALKRYTQNSGIQFCQLEYDRIASEFLKNNRVAPAWKVVTHSMLRFFMSHYDANAYLNMYPLHLLSTDQFESLLCQAGAPKKFSMALDVGAGDGSMAQDLLLPRVATVHATETSKRMHKKLLEKGIVSTDADLAQADAKLPPSFVNASYELIMLLNVLDRTDKPKTLLTNLVQKMSPNGHIVIASPLPFRQVFYDNATARRPKEMLLHPNAIKDLESNDPWDVNAAWLMKDFLPSVGLQTKVFTRLPYVSGGDFTNRVYTYDDICVVCSKNSQQK